MEMRAIDHIAFGQDLTPPLRPLAAVLRDSALTSHCSACFSNLPIPHFTPTFPQNTYHAPSDTPTPLYCSPRCSAYDSPHHLSSGEAHLLQSPPSTWNDSSDLRLSLRLVPIFQNRKIESFEGPDTETRRRNDAVSERIAGLMTNREKLVFGPNRNDPDGNAEHISEGARLIAEARRACSENQDDDFAFVEMVLCLVLTNAVEVQDKSGRSIGIALYGAAFSWINHSCSPNACYRFSARPEVIERRPLRITPTGKNGCDLGGVSSNVMESFQNEYGPRVVVRSIKDVEIGEEVTIAYTDLLQPKEMRRVELWVKYRFDCNCKRCNANPITYVDNALQEPLTSASINLEKMTESFEDAITDYLSSGDPIPCCNNLENLLTQCHFIDPKSPQPMNPFQYFSLNAYTTLASAYRVRANDFLALAHSSERLNLEAFNMRKTGAAYSLLLAGGAHHLFMHEPALIATVVNFWTNAGESMLDLAGSSSWGSFFLDCTSQKCNKCDVFLGAESVRQRRVCNCIVDVTPKVWSLLASESGFLREIRSPVDFSWLAHQESRPIIRTLRSDSDEEVRMNLVSLGDHCLRYAALLSSVCYGSPGETENLVEDSCVLE